MDWSLWNLEEKGTIRRLARGIYDYPKQHPEIGPLAPDPNAVARAMTASRGQKLQPSGAYAANLLGLSEQVPARIVYLTDGKSRKVEIGNQTIELKNRAPSSLQFAGQPAGLVIEALRFLGKDHIDDTTIRQLRDRLDDIDRSKLPKAKIGAPAWMHRWLDSIAQDHE